MIIAISGGNCRVGAQAGSGCRYASVMPKKRKKKIFSAAKVVREMARERVGSPKPSSFVPGKKKKAEKHRPTLEKLMEDQ